MMRMQNIPAENNALWKDLPKLRTKIEWQIALAHIVIDEGQSKGEGHCAANAQDEQPKEDGCCWPNIANVATAANLFNLWMMRTLPS